MSSDRSKFLKQRYLPTIPSGLHYPMAIWKELVSPKLRFLAYFLTSWKRIRINYDLVPHKTTIFLGWCGAHKIYYLDYEHGWRKEIFCPECFKEVRKRRSPT